jgi:hypothetical protein
MVPELAESSLVDVAAEEAPELVVVNAVLLLAGKGRGNDIKIGR